MGEWLIGLGLLIASYHVFWKGRRKKPVPRELTVAELTGQAKVRATLKPESGVQAKFGPRPTPPIQEPRPAAPAESMPEPPLVSLVKLPVTHDRKLRQIELPEDLEGSLWDASAVEAAGGRLQIVYVDAAGSVTTRAITVRRIGAIDDDYLITAHCSLRNDRRTFRASRIESCVDLDTGEVVEDVAAYLYAQRAETTDGIADKLRDEEGDVLKILFYLGKADGQFRADERAIVRRTAHAILGDTRLTDKIIDSVLRDFGVPSMQSFKVATGRVARKDRATKDIIIAAAQAMVATQKTVAPLEAQALAYIEKRLA